MNLIRVAYQALAAVLGGCQSLHTNSMDETLALPSEHAVTLALRTQQVLAYETGVTNTADPVGGSYFVETLTRQMQDEAHRYFDRIAEQGGMLSAIDRGFFRREIAEAAFAFQREFDCGTSWWSASTRFNRPTKSRSTSCRSTKRSKASKSPRWPRSSGGGARKTCAARSTPCACAAEAKQNILPALLDAAPCARHRERSDARAGRRVRPLRLDGRLKRGPHEMDHQPPLRIVLAKVGLDGHDRGVKVVTRALRDAGFHVIYPGLWQSPEAVVRTVADEDADWLGISLLSGTHMTLVPKIIAMLEAAKLRHVGVLVGGIIPEADVPKLSGAGRGARLRPRHADARNRGVSSFAGEPHPCLTKCSRGSPPAIDWRWRGC